MLVGLEWPSHCPAPVQAGSCDLELQGMPWDMATLDVL